MHDTQPPPLEEGTDAVNKTSKTLFVNATVGALTVPNRSAMAPMSRARAAADGTPTALMSDYYGVHGGAPGG